MRVGHFRGTYWPPDLIALPTQPRLPPPRLPQPPFGASDDWLGACADCRSALGFARAVAPLFAPLLASRFFALLGFQRTCRWLDFVAVAFQGQTRSVRATTTSSAASSVHRLRARASSLGELRKRGTTLRAPLSVDLALVTPDPVERRLQASRKSFAIGCAFHLASALRRAASSLALPARVRQSGGAPPQRVLLRPRQLPCEPPPPQQRCAPSPPSVAALRRARLDGGRLAASLRCRSASISACRWRPQPLRCVGVLPRVPPAAWRPPPPPCVDVPHLAQPAVGRHLPPLCVDVPPPARPADGPPRLLCAAAPPPVRPAVGRHPPPPCGAARSRQRVAEPQRLRAGLGRCQSVYS